MNSISRRHFVQTTVSLAIGAAGMVLPRNVTDDWWHRWNLKPDSQAEGLTAYLNHGNLFVRYDNLPLLNYRAHPTLKYPYFMPLNGPVSGLSLTAESALPYPHHRGLWLGCEPLDGGDYWSDNELSSGHIQSTNLQLHDSDEEGVVHFTDQCSWLREGAESPFEDSRTFRVHVPDETSRILDCRFVITARKDIRIDNAKHAFFAIRCAPDIAPTYGGRLLNSEGDEGAEGTYGKPARWCSYFGPRRLRPDVVEGIAVMDHPDNFSGNCPWFTRDYGHLSPQPFEFLKEPFRMSVGETLELQYRIVLHVGTPNQANLDRIYEQWV